MRKIKRKKPYGRIKIARYLRILIIAIIGLIIIFSAYSAYAAHQQITTTETRPTFTYSQKGE